MINGRMGAAQVKAFQGDDLSKTENMATEVFGFVDMWWLLIY